MSSIVAIVSDMQSFDSLHRVEFSFHTEKLSMISLELSQDIQIGAKVKLAIAPSHIAISKNFEGNVSYSNILNSTIISIDNGKILSSIRLKFFDTIIESIITLRSSQRMNLQVGDEVQALFKATELSISEVL